MKRFPRQVYAWHVRQRVQKLSPLRIDWRNVPFFLTTLLVIAADQASKVWIRTILDRNESAFELGFFRIIHVNNTGASFGLFQGQTFVLTIVGIVSSIVLLLLVLRFSHHFPFLNNRLSMLTLGLIFGGTVGNLIDRLRLGYVTDFIDLGVWPVFNIADSSLTVGIIILAYILLFMTQPKKSDLST